MLEYLKIIKKFRSKVKIILIMRHYSVFILFLYPFFWAPQRLVAVRKWKKHHVDA